MRKVRIMKVRPPHADAPWPPYWGWYWVSPGHNEYGNFYSKMTWQQAYDNAYATLRGLGFVK